MNDFVTTVRDAAKACFTVKPKEIKQDYIRKYMGTH